MFITSPTVPVAMPMVSVAKSLTTSVHAFVILPVKPVSVDTALVGWNNIPGSVITSPKLCRASAQSLVTSPNISPPTFIPSFASSPTFSVG